MSNRDNSNKPTRRKYRANVKGFNDADYLDSLSPEEKAWYDQFAGEYYANEINRDGSIHKEELDEEAFKKAKKETFDATNAQNRDTYAITGTSSCLQFIEDERFYDQLVTPIKKLTNIIDPGVAYKIFLEETIEELQGEDSRDMTTVLNEFAMELVKLGASISKQRTNKILKKRRLKKEAKLKENRDGSIK